MKLGIPQSSLARQALLAAGLMMAWQVAAKATRDTLFLAVYDTTALPAAVGASAIFSILIAVLTARLLRSFGPARIIPSAYLAGALLHGIEYVLLPEFPRAVGAAVYLHVMSLGPVLLSGFWALANERFDPREARRRFGQITAFGTLGAVVGGLLGERVSSLGPHGGLLLLLTVLQLLCGLALFRFAPPRSTEFKHGSQSIPDVISGAPYLLGLICFVLLTSTSAALLDYLFKFNAVAAFGKNGPKLGQFFNLFYAITSAITFALQAVVSQMWMKRFGPGGTVAVLPIAVAGASVLSLFSPTVVAIIITRGVEQLLRGSLYRSGYELFYTPMPADEKRTTKPVIDIGVDRLGDGLAAAGIQLVIHSPAPVTQVLLGATAVIAASAAWLAFRLDKAYVNVLERGLAKQSVHILPDEAEDILTHTVALRSMTAMTIGGPAGSTMMQESSAAPVLPPDPVLMRLVELRSGNVSRIRAALQKPLEPLVVPQVIELLGQDDVARRVHDILVESGPKVTGALVDGLSNTTIPVKVRRRIPRILAGIGGRIAWEGLLAQLTDQSFDIRHRCGRALDKVRQRHPDFRPNHDMICEIVSRELSAHRPASSSSAALRMSTSGSQTQNLPRDQASLLLNHISNLLALVLPPQSIGLAFRALLTDDPKLRATALEYLDSVLPERLRDQIAAQFERSPQQAARPAVKGDEALSQLMQATPTIMAKLAELGVKEDRDA